MAKRKPGREWSAAGMPQLRDRMVGLINYAVDTIESRGADTTRHTVQSVDETIRQAKRDLSALPNAPLYWVTPNLVDLVVHAAGTEMPDWTPTLAMPSPTGLMLWAKPIAKQPWTDDYDQQREVTIDGVSWAMHPDGLKLAVWSRLGEHREGQRPHIRRRSSLAEIYAFHSPDPDTSAKLSLDLDRQDQGLSIMSLVGATWLMQGQEQITTSRVLRGDSGRTAKAGEANDAPTVQIVDLRLYPAVENPKDDQPADRADDESRWTHRWWVGKPHGFWRQQACGPGHSQRKPKWIAPFIKGPDDKPVVAERVHLLR
ncbi:hypothetical protein [Nocardia brasiliensis]|uniref:hypothetical protein n=1 Tax=Nocardia brasiliensis TaxID=37326 RepID=UPI002456D168|nr:hypothetical protein [Nocardia brasiliensis]